ncbi:hypothetical protein OAS1_19320 [Bacillus sp. YKCMOAS1]|nr:hypothetical protein OAS1_19320 [Bacillus sp. YKCMOAS1]
MRFGNNRTKVSMFMGTFFICNAEKKPRKRGIKRGPFFLSGSSYDRDKQNEREYFVQKEESADADH